MLSPAKAITAGAIVFALGGVMLIAQPFDQQGVVVPGAEVDSTVTVVRGQYSGGSGNWVGGEYLERPAGMIERRRDAQESGRLEMSDARLSGDATITVHIDRWRTSEVRMGDVALFWGTVVIENDGGTWEGTHLAADGQAPDRAFVQRTMQLVGSGDYEGLSAILYWTEALDLPDSVDGLIFSGNLPPDR